MCSYRESQTGIHLEHASRAQQINIHEIISQRARAPLPPPPVFHASGSTTNNTNSRPAKDHTPAVERAACTYTTTSQVAYMCVCATFSRENKNHSALKVGGWVEGARKKFMYFYLFAGRAARGTISEQLSDREQRAR